MWKPEFIGSDRPYLDGSLARELTLVKKLPWNEGTHIAGHCHLFRDADGHCIVWFSRRKNLLEVGARLLAQFTIKSHRMYNGTHENVVKQFTYELTTLPVAPLG